MDTHMPVVHPSGAGRLPRCGATGGTLFYVTPETCVTCPECKALAPDAPVCGPDMPPEVFLTATYTSTAEQLDRNEVLMLVTAGSWSAPSETIYDLIGHPDRLSREMLLAYGHAQPTQEEREKAANALREAYADAVSRWLDTNDFLERVKEAEFTGLAKAVMQMHALSSIGDCEVCVDSWNDSHVQWPCATARLALDDAGVSLPKGDLVYKKPEPPLRDPDNPHWPYPKGPVARFTFPEVSVNRGGLRYDTGGH